MSVELTPSDILGFHRPLTALVKRTLTVSNPNKVPIAFKVKTTAPKQYCRSLPTTFSALDLEPRPGVRPNAARLEPNERIEVQVLLQPMKEDPPEDAKCRDKFLVQSAAISAQYESVPLAELWAALDGHRDQIKEQKIRCTYLPSLDSHGLTPPEGVAAAANGYANGQANQATPASPHSYSQDTPTSLAKEASSSDQSNYLADTLDRPSASPSTPTTNGVAATPETKPATQIIQEVGSKPISESIKDASSSITVKGAAAGAAVAGAAAALSSKTSAAYSSTVSPTPTRDASDLQEQLASAQKEIARLQAQLKTAESRAATPAASNQDSSALFAQQLGQAGQEGQVPVQTVAMLCVGVFVFTWLFF